MSLLRSQSNLKDWMTSREFRCEKYNKVSKAGKFSQINCQKRSPNAEADSGGTKGSRPLDISKFLRYPFIFSDPLGIVTHIL